MPDELPGWSKVRAKSDKISQKYLLKDDILRDAISLFKRKASSPQGALVNASSWAEFEGSNKSMMWVSVWSPAMLTQCASVTIAAANFNDSLTGLLTRRLHPDARIETEVVAGRPRASCEVAIHYFTQGHRGSTSFWKDGDGADYLHDIHMFLKDIELGYWSGNEVVLERFRRMKGLKVRPKQEGTNALMATTSCAYIYSNKRQRSDQPLMDLFQITEDEIERARETEDIFQFVIRGGPRDPSFTGRYDIYLYDKVQAERLADYLRSNGIGTVELIAEKIGDIMDARRKKIARSNQPVDESSRTDRENARAQKARDRAQRNRDRKKAEKEQAGIEIKRGRPRKHQPKGFSHRRPTLFRNLVPSSRASMPSTPPLTAGNRRSRA